MLEIEKKGMQSLKKFQFLIPETFESEDNYELEKYNEFMRSDESKASFSISKENLNLFCKLVTMQGSITDSKQEKRKTSSLYSLFFGCVLKDEEKGWLIAVTNNSSRSSFSRIMIPVDVKKEGLIWCGDTKKFSKICKEFDFGDSALVSFSPEKINIYNMADPEETNCEIRNSDIRTFGDIKNSLKYLEKIKIDDDVWMYGDHVLTTSVFLKPSDLEPVIAASEFVGQLYYPISIREKEGKFFLLVEVADEENVKIKKSIKNIVIEGMACDSSYSVGFDAMVMNFPKERFEIAFGNWTPLVAISKGEDYDLLMVLSVNKKDSAVESTWEEPSEEENIPDDEEGDEEKEEEEEERVKPKKIGKKKKEKEIESVEEQETIPEDEEQQDFD